MPEQLEGSVAVARAVAACRPDVVCAYPITPQTHIVEGLSRMVRDGSLPGCEFVNVESEFAALSVAIGASATGARAYTATASQGLLYMAEALYSASGLGLPIVMTVANRAIGAPINIWNDHSDAMSQRDCGWLQLYAADNQEAVDLHVQAFRIAEELSVPVMVCMDGFVLTHAFERVELPTAEQVEAFLPSYEPRQVLDPAHPLSIGAMVGPEAFTEVRYLAHLTHQHALEVIPTLGLEYGELVGRPGAGLVAPYGDAGAATVVVALGSVLGTLQETVDDLAAQGHAFGVLGITTFRPFPAEAVRRATEAADRVVVIERSMFPGAAPAVTAEVRAALAGRGTRIDTVVAGLGGRPVTRASLRRMLLSVERDELDPLTFLDLDVAMVERASAPHAVEAGR